MKLETTIPPRKDGTVNAEFSGIVYRFTPDEHGRLVAEVGNETHIATLLATDMFLPADENDFARASEIANTETTEEGEDDGEGDGEGEESLDALPLEAVTPPSHRRARKVK
jgi:hypothetical protein